jgi:hypothetical protein
MFALDGSQVGGDSRRVSHVCSRLLTGGRRQQGSEPCLLLMAHRWEDTAVE